MGHGIPMPVVLVVLAVFGAFVGRFLNVCVQEFPRHDLLRDQLKAVVPPWSLCHRCHAKLAWGRCLPIVGWFMAGRRCASCRTKLSFSLPVIELITAVLFALLYWCEIPAEQSATAMKSGLRSVEGPPGPEVITTLWSPAVWLHLRYAFHMLMICGLIVATEIDRKLRIIPDGCTVPIMLLALPLSLLLGQLYITPIWFQDASVVRMLREVFDLPAVVQPLLYPWDPTEFIQNSPHIHGFLVSFCGLVVGGGSVWIVRIIGFLTLKQEAMGFGDVVLMAMVGSVIGWQPVLAVFIVGAPILALLFAITNWIVRGENEIPYGPFLSGATILLLVAWPTAWPFAKRFFDMGPVLFLMGVAATFSLAASLYVVQVVKRFLGLTAFDEEDGSGWSSADHLSYYNGERPDEQTGLWSQEQWPGSRAGRGLKPYRDWRDGSGD